MNEIIRKIDEEIEMYRKRIEARQGANYHDESERIMRFEERLNEAIRIKEIIQAEQEKQKQKQIKFHQRHLNELLKDEPKTNGDLIREMNNEDLANWIFEKIESTEWDEDGNNNYEDDIAEWLDEVVSENNKDIVH